MTCRSRLKNHFKWSGPAYLPLLIYQKGMNVNVDIIPLSIESLSSTSLYCRCIAWNQNGHRLTFIGHQSPFVCCFVFFLIPGVPFIYSFTHFVFYFLLCLFFYLSYSIFFVCVFVTKPVCRHSTRQTGRTNDLFATLFLLSRPIWNVRSSAIGVACASIRLGFWLLLWLLSTHGLVVC